MDAKLVAMLKEPIRQVVPMLDKGGAGSSSDLMQNLPEEDNPDYVALMTNAVDVDAKDSTKDGQSDNNATIAIKKLYASCMNEGNESFRLP